ncbi:hypothetical protein CP533_1662, partial [Ophiocordyceps camponoti-saundersi (nom. inval.)]
KPIPRCSAALLSKASTSLLQPPTRRALSTTLSLHFSRSSPRPKDSRDPDAWSPRLKSNENNTLKRSSSVYNSNQQFWSKPESSPKTPVDDPLESLRKPVLPPPPPPPPPAANPFTDAFDNTQDNSSPATPPKHPYDTNDRINVHHAVEEIYRGTVSTVVDPRHSPKIHTKAVTGRTVFIIPRRSGPNTAPTVTAAFRVMNRLVREQKLRQKFNFQKTHWRPGLKRKMLKSKRWRQRFKEAFQVATQRCKELCRQGW